MHIASSHCSVGALILLLAGVVPVHGAEIERSPADTREYRAVRLDNGLEALVVSDPDADKAAAALNVDVGSGNDPETRPGLAHFLEHMLFLGTEKYPDPGEYSRFLTEHGGSSDATTSFADTSYLFDVDAAYLEGALDRFAQFFVAPRFDRDYVERERQVVHSEYVSRLRSDRIRRYAAWKQALTLRPGETDTAGREHPDEYHQVFVVETKGIHMKQSADTDCKRSVFDICTEHASRKDWAELAPAMRGKVMRFEIVDEEEWEQRLNAMLAAQGRGRLRTLSGLPRSKVMIAMRPCVWTER